MLVVCDKRSTARHVLAPNALAKGPGTVVESPVADIFAGHLGSL